MPSTFALTNVSPPEVKQLNLGTSYHQTMQEKYNAVELQAYLGHWLPESTKDPNHIPSTKDPKGFVSAGSWVLINILKLLLVVAMFLDLA